MKITPAQLSAFYKEKGATENCPFCQLEKWSAPAFTSDHHNFSDNEEMDIMDSQVLLIGASGAPSAHIPVIAVTCINCGFVRYQHALLLNIWLQAKGQKDEH